MDLRNSATTDRGAGRRRFSSSFDEGAALPSNLGGLPTCVLSPPIAPNKNFSGRARRSRFQLPSCVSSGAPPPHSPPEPESRHRCPGHALPIALRRTLLAKSTPVGCLPPPAPCCGAGATLNGCALFRRWLRKRRGHEVLLEGPSNECGSSESSFRSASRAPCLRFWDAPGDR